MTKDVFTLARNLGQAQARTRALMPELALGAIDAAIAGKIDVDDANDLYHIYVEASEPEDEPTPNSLKANASKLRQIIAAAVENKDTRKVFARVIEMHQGLRKKQKVLSLYKAMIVVARWMKDRPGAVPSDAQLQKIICTRSKGE